AENANGVFASLDFNGLRMANGAPAWSSAALTGTEITSTAEVPMYCTFWGTPANADIDVTTAFNMYQFPNSEGLPYYINNDPASAITPAPSSAAPVSVNPPPVIATVATVGGYGTLNITANALSQQEIDGVQNGRRSALPSQLYLYNHQGSMDTIGQPLTVLVFVNTSSNATTPTWTNDIEPILGQYAQLYPGMRSILDIGDYNTVKNNPAIRKVLNLAMTDPGLMPVTRDLSPADLAMINTWYANGCPQ
ncbi:MAG TPA: hypothetical protein VN181_03895, partial [Thermoanaerobaculia bacterium]|nr:hypothetical protein [Thermoanaerobaculia bacterium]